MLMRLSHDDEKVNGTHKKWLGTHKDKNQDVFVWTVYVTTKLCY